MTLSLELSLFGCGRVASRYAQTIGELPSALLGSGDGYYRVPRAAICQGITQRRTRQAVVVEN